MRKRLHSILHVAMFTCIATSTPAIAQEIRFQGVAWGESRERVTALFRGLGFRDPQPTNEGDLRFISPDSLWNVTAEFGRGALVQVSLVTGGDTAIVMPIFAEFVRRATVERGPGRMTSGAIHQSFEWEYGQTRLWASFDSGDYTTADTTMPLAPSGRATILISYQGPGHSEEFQRRIAPYVAQAEARRREWLTDRIGSRWQVVYFTDSLAVSFDPTRVERTGQVIRVWERWDDRISKREPGEGYSVDSRIWLVDLDCASLRWRLREVILYLGGRVQDSHTISSPRWSSLVPGTIGEDSSREICDAVLRR
jgi:hypothetical protein